MEWELRRITPSDATSDCIGDPRTPVCAVETFIACSARHHRPLCRRIGVGDSFSFTGTVETREYAIVYQKRLRPEDIPSYPKDAYWAKPGYVEVQIIRRYCRAGQQTCPEEPWWLYTYTIKLAEAGFVMVSWYGEGYPD